MIPGKHQSKSDQTGFVEQIIEAVDLAKKSEGSEVVLSFDPMHQTHNNENGYLWQIKGKEGTKRVRSNTGRRRLNILGAINMVTLDIIPFLTEENCDKETIKAYLGEVKRVCASAKKITIFLDNARYQRNFEVQEYAQKLGITLRFMPPYSPNLCLIERLWKFFKKKVIKNHYYESFDDFFQFISQFFQNWDQWKSELRSLLTLNFEII